MPKINKEIKVTNIKIKDDFIKPDKKMIEVNNVKSKKNLVDDALKDKISLKTRQSSVLETAFSLFFFLIIVPIIIYLTYMSLATVIKYFSYSDIYLAKSQNIDYEGIIVNDTYGIITKL